MEKDEVYATVRHTVFEIKPESEQDIVLLTRKQEKYGFYTGYNHPVYMTAPREQIPEIEQLLTEAREFVIRGEILKTLVDDLITKSKTSGPSPELTKSIEGLLMILGAKQH